MDKGKLFIIMPAYNEELIIKTTVSDWYYVINNVVPDMYLVVVNDGSKDRTLEELRILEKKYDKLIVIDKKNGGHGSAVLHGYRYALKQDAGYIFQTDSDGQTNPAEFEKFWNQRWNYDAIIGWRKKRGDGILRKIIEDILCLILKMIFGVRLHDANAPYRLMKADLVKEYIDMLPSDYNLPNVMLTVFCAYYKKRMKYMEISFGERKSGENSMNTGKIIGIGFNSIKGFCQLKKKMQQEKL